MIYTTLSRDGRNPIPIDKREILAAIAEREKKR